MSSKIQIFFDPFGNTLNLWWGKPDTDSLSQESANGEDVMIVNKNDQVIGLEKLNFFPKEIDPIKYLKGEIKSKLDIFFLNPQSRKLISSSL